MASQKIFVRQQNSMQATRELTACLDWELACQVPEMGGRGKKRPKFELHQL